MTTSNGPTGMAAGTGKRITAEAHSGCHFAARWDTAEYAVYCHSNVERYHGMQTTDFCRLLRMGRSAAYALFVLSTNKKTEEVS